MKKKIVTKSSWNFEKRLKKAFKGYLNQEKKNDRKLYLEDKIEEVLEKKEMREMKRKFIKSEKRLYIKKLELAREIFEWRNKLLSTTIGKRIMNDAWPYNEHGWGLPVYSGDCGHRELKKINTKKRQPNLIVITHPTANLSVKKKGVIYEYDWCQSTRQFTKPVFCGITCIFKTPEKMARSLTYNYLTKVDNSIASGNTLRRITEVLQNR